MTAPVTRRTVRGAGLDLAVFEQGDPLAPTVLLVHGYPDTHRVWDDVAADLAADHHVVRYDVRGAGSPRCPPAAPGTGSNCWPPTCSRWPTPSAPTARCT